MSPRKDLLAQDEEDVKKKKIVVQKAGDQTSIPPEAPASSEDNFDALRRVLKKVKERKDGPGDV